MTSTDLRVKFKLDTGKYPAWVNPPAPDRDSFKGKVKSIYGWWLEEQLGNPRGLRLQFQIDEGVSAVYPRRNMFEGFRCSYTLWLENKLLDKLR